MKCLRAIRFAVRLTGVLCSRFKGVRRQRNAAGTGFLAASGHGECKQQRKGNQSESGHEGAHPWTYSFKLSVQLPVSVPTNKFCAILSTAPRRCRFQVKPAPSSVICSAVVRAILPPPLEVSLSSGSENRQPSRYCRRTSGLPTRPSPSNAHRA